MRSVGTLVKRLFTAYRQDVKHLQLKSSISLKTEFQFNILSSKNCNVRLEFSQPNCANQTDRLRRTWHDSAILLLQCIYQWLRSSLVIISIYLCVSDLSEVIISPKVTLIYQTSSVQLPDTLYSSKMDLEISIFR